MSNAETDARCLNEMRKAGWPIKGVKMTNTEALRENLHCRLGVVSQGKRSASQVEMEITRMLSSLNRISELARPRLIMGGIRYGSNWTHEVLMEYMQKKFDLYKETGNFEALIDLFNFVAVEGQLKTHPHHHFNSLDRE